jgi:homoaconitase/3-isopropylmalate dehydratase large subunit
LPTASLSAHSGTRLEPSQRRLRNGWRVAFIVDVGCTSANFGTFMTLTEKILARAAGKARAEAGDNVWVNADVLMTHDVCGPGTIGVFKREFGEAAKVWDRNKVVIIPDHYIFTADSKSNRNVDILRDFVKEQTSLLLRCD